MEKTKAKKMETINFDKAVIEKSFEKPVVVDFWAPWCGPCRVLGPTIEQLAREQADRWELVKVNTEEDYEIAEQYRIRSIPNVKLFYQGDVIAEFAGALPRTAIEEWLDEHLPDERRKDLSALLAAVEGGANGEALEQLVAFAEANPNLTEAAVTAAQRLVFRDPARAARLVEGVTLGDKYADAAEDIRQIGRLMTFEPGDAPVAKKLAEAREALSRQDLAAAIQRLIDATMIDKSYEDDLPRKTAIALFRTLGDEHPLTKQYRRMFDMALY